MFLGRMAHEARGALDRHRRAVFAVLLALTSQEHRAALCAVSGAADGGLDQSAACRPGLESGLAATSVRDGPRAVGGDHIDKLAALSALLQLAERRPRPRTSLAA